MIIKNKDCNSVQANIAWGKSLDLVDKKHILDCHRCSNVAVQFEELDSLMKNESINIPSDFADRVMQKITQQEKQKKSLNISAFPESIMAFLDNSLLRWSIGGVGFLFAFSAL
jgi:hypothetical protein